MPYTLQYNKLVEREEAISKTNILPRNLYRISTYKYADGVRKNLGGMDSAIVFVFGKTQDTLFCIKANDVRPEKFFAWLKTLKLNKPIDLDNIKTLDEALVLSDKEGKGIYNSYIKGKEIYNVKPCPYRTYTIKGIGNIKQIFIQKSVIKEHLSQS
jgi:hypothetical protein